MLPHRVVSLSALCQQRNGSLVLGAVIETFQRLGGFLCPGCVANRNPIGIGLLMSNLNRSDYDYDNDNDKRLHGILAAVDLSAEMRERVLRAGFYVARSTITSSRWMFPTLFSPTVMVGALAPAHESWAMLSPSLT
jgi:hypothetical protein